MPPYPSGCAWDVSAAEAAEGGTWRGYRQELEMAITVDVSEICDIIVINYLLLASVKAYSVVSQSPSRERQEYCVISRFSGGKRHFLQFQAMASLMSLHTTYALRCVETIRREAKRV
jgi:hypothetical protein